MRILVISFSFFLLNGCFIHSSANKSWNDMNEMFKNANGREICMKYKGRAHVMYYCENSNQNINGN